MKEKDGKTSVKTKKQFNEYKDGLVSRGLILPVWWGLIGKKSPTPEDLAYFHLWADEADE